jgi:integrase
MGSIYPKQNKLWVCWKDEAGKWRNSPTPYRAGDEAKARQFLRHLEAQTEAARAAAASGAPVGPLTLAVYARQWLDGRAKLGLVSASDEDTRLNRHVLPTLGHMLLADVRPRHIRDLVLELRRDGKLAPRTIHHVYHATASMFRDAVADELLLATPCVLRKGVLPKKADKDPAWRDTAVYDRTEVERLISDPRILEDRRVLYALKGLAGLRHGEAAGLRWSQYDATMEPLGSVALHRTKTQVPRRVPVHPTLARVLAEWKLAGWERTYGRAPTAEDFIVPSRNMTSRSKHEAPKQLAADLALLELRPRRGHDLRRTFITLAQVDGARRDLLQAVSHGPRGDIVSVYTTFPWPALCAEVAKLQLHLRDDLVAELGGALPTALPATHRRARNRWRKTVTPPGIESAGNHARNCVEARSAGEKPGRSHSTQSHAMARCNECDEMVPRLAGVAKNALFNGDFPRVVQLLDHLRRVPSQSPDGVGEGALTAGRQDFRSGSN